MQLIPTWCKFCRNFCPPQHCAMKREHFTLFKVSLLFLFCFVFSSCWEAQAANPTPVGLPYCDQGQFVYGEQRKCIPVRVGKHTSSDEAKCDTQSVKGNRILSLMVGLFLPCPNKCDNFKPRKNPCCLVMQLAISLPLLCSRTGVSSPCEESALEICIQLLFKKLYLCIQFKICVDSFRFH